MRRNLLKIASLTIAMVMLLTCAVFADTLGDNEAVNFKLKLASSEAIKVGDSFDVILYGENGTKTTMDNAALMAGVAYSTENFVANSCTIAGTELSAPLMSSDDADAELYTNDVFIMTETGASYNYSTIATINFTASKEGTFTIKLHDIAAYDPDTGLATDQSNLDLMIDTLTITVTAAGEEEEEFDLSYEGVKAEDGTVSEGFASGSKVATVFAKADEALAAGEYGIVFGGQTYVGAAPVAAGKYWVIKLYDPTSTILESSSYKYKIFAGDYESEEQTYTFN